MLDKLAGLLPASLVVKLWKLPMHGSLRRLAIWHCSAHFIAGVIGLVYSENGDLLVVKHTYKKTAWGLPGGAIKHEQPMDGLAREVFEETGFKIRPEKVLDVSFSKKPPELLVIVQARLLGGVFCPSAEVCDFRFIRPPSGLERLSHRQRDIVLGYYNNVKGRGL